MLELVPMTLKAAMPFVREHHRHRPIPTGGLWAVGVRDSERGLVGCAIVGRPSARMLDDGRTAEVTRLVTDGTPNACSMLLAACRKACQALGYHRCVTYTLPAESGASLRAAGWIDHGVAGGGSWQRSGRTSTYAGEAKTRWEAQMR